jgi:hypothetical protein
MVKVFRAKERLDAELERLANEQQEKKENKPDSAEKTT